MTSLHVVGLECLLLLLRLIPVDFPGRWRLERFAVATIRRVGPAMRPRIVRTADGFRVWADPGEWIGQYIAATGRYEEASVAAMKNRLRPGDCVVDVGANIGYLTLVAAKLVGQQGSVVAFEPLPKARLWLERNIALNGFRQVTVRSEAVCDRNGSATLNVGPTHHTSTSSLLAEHTGAESIDVQCVTLDDALSKAPAIRFIKIDVEGVEHLVVDGATRTLLRDSPDLLVEINSPEVVEMLDRCGYSGRGLDGTPLGPFVGQTNAVFTKAD